MDAQRESETERLVVFTDAVAAIAITLLVLPLVDIVPEAAHRDGDVGALLREHVPQFGGFVLSFAVIARFWWSHHELFRTVTRLSRAVVRWNLVWTFAIVALPLPTAIITAYRPSPLTVELYVGTLVLATAALAGIARAFLRRDDLTDRERTAARQQLLGSAVSAGLLLLAAVVGSLVPAVNFFALLLLFASGPVERVLRRRWTSATPG
ncbi:MULTISPECIES: TMEM175 family protein [unclassified Curtobacterium]|uniref:TMEM175 family protein n=1 Tax=unclassified Curtobacterium TaxID=257496 RepID=UPI0015E88A1E|nr:MULTISPECIES: TMEM175 family protein [unclassified Curtobacterium]WIE54977.1 TMEM175 family protein [Curtobacterium sp. MCBD17_003]